MAYNFPFRFKSEAINEEAIFIPLGYDNLSLINDSVMKMDVSKPYEEVIVSPQVKKVQKEEVMVEEESKYFEKYINIAPSTSTTTVTETSTSIASSSSVNKSIT